MRAKLHRSDDFHTIGPTIGRNGLDSQSLFEFLFWGLAGRIGKKWEKSI